VVQQTPGKPGVAGIPPADVAFDGHVELPGRMLEGVGFGVGIAGTPLIPAFPISVEPIGIPVRLAPPGEIVGADDGFAALPPAPEVPLQGEAPFPDAAMPVAPPVLVPPPSNVEVDVPDIPNPTLPAEHGAVLPTKPCDGTPKGMGLTPVVPSPVAPNGMPAGPTGRLPVMPSGEVGSMPDGAADGVCARARLAPRRAAAIVAINKRVMAVFPCSR
jgi:hypothetical protein